MNNNKEISRSKQLSKKIIFVDGIAGCGKTTLTSHWLELALEKNPKLDVMYYPCQPWDSSLGIATSLLHRLKINSDEDNQDPYGVLDSLPMKPGAHLDLDQYRRRLNQLQ